MTDTPTRSSSFIPQGWLDEQDRHLDHAERLERQLYLIQHGRLALDHRDRLEARGVYGPITAEPFALGRGGTVERMAVRCWLELDGGADAIAAIDQLDRPTRWAMVDELDLRGSGLGQQLAAAGAWVEHHVNMFAVIIGLPAGAPMTLAVQLDAIGDREPAR